MPVEVLHTGFVAVLDLVVAGRIDLVLVVDRIALDPVVDRTALDLVAGHIVLDSAGVVGRTGTEKVVDRIGIVDLDPDLDLVVHNSMEGVPKVEHTVPKWVYIRKNVSTNQNFTTMVSPIYLHV